MNWRLNMLDRWRARGGADELPRRPHRRGAWFAAGLLGIGLLIGVVVGCSLLDQDLVRRYFGFTLALVAVLLAAALVGVLSWQRREAALAQRVEHLMKCANDVVLLTDGDWKIVEANDRAEETYQYTRAELRDMRPAELRVPEARATFPQLLAQLNNCGSAFFETRHQRKDGSTLPVEVSARMVEIGGVRYGLSIIRDLTQRQAQAREIERLTRLYATLSQINQSIVRLQSREALFQEACRIAVQYAGFKLAWIGWTDPATQRLAPVGRAGDDEGYLDQIEVYATDDRPEGRGPIGVCVREGRPGVFNDFLNDPSAQPWRKAAAAHNLRAVVALPIRFGGAVGGAFTVYADEPQVFRDKEVALLEEIAADISFALEQLEQVEQRRRVEVALRESEAKFRSYVENAPHAVFVTDLEGRYVEFNSAARELLDYDGDELRRMSVPEVLADEDREAGLRNFTQVVQHGCAEGDFRLQRKDGRLCWVSVRAVCLGTDRVMAFCQDISARKEAEAALRESENFARSILDALSAHVCVLDDSGTIVAVNRAWREFAAANPPQSSNVLEGANYLAACEAATETDADEAKAFAQGIRAVIRNETSYFHHEYACHSPTEKRWFLGRVTRFAEAGEARVVVAHENITLRKRAEEASRKSEQRLLTLMSNLPVGLFRNTPGERGRFLMANPAMARIFGYATVEAFLKCPVWELYQDPKNRAQFAAELVVAGFVDGQELQLKRKDGTPICARVTARAIRNDQGKVMYFDGTVEDITATKHAEQERLSMQVQLHQAQKLESIGRLASGIAHEINTPTQYIGDNTRFLQDAFADLRRLLVDYDRLRREAEARAVLPELTGQVLITAQAIDAEYLAAEIPTAIQQSLEGIERVSRIVRAMKEFSHPGGGDRTAIDLNRAIESTVTVARNEWKYVAEMVLNLDESLPPVQCLADEFNQVILNLIINAAHAIADVVGDGSEDKGTITVSTRRNGEWVEVGVADTGTGNSRSDPGPGL